MGFFQGKGIGGARMPRQSENIRPGTYLVHLNEFIGKQTRAGWPAAIFSMTVVAVFDTSDADALGKAPHRVGDVISWVIKLSGDSGPGDLKRALVTATLEPEEVITDEFSDLCCSDAQPLAGIFVEISAKEIKTKKTGSPFTLVRFKRRWMRDELESNKAVMDSVARLKLSVERA